MFISNTIVNKPQNKCGMVFLDGLCYLIVNCEPRLTKVDWTHLEHNDTQNFGFHKYLFKYFRVV